MAARKIKQEFKFPCTCGKGYDTYGSWYQHCKRGNEKEPGAHGKPGAEVPPAEVAPTPEPVAEVVQETPAVVEETTEPVTAPVIHTNGHGNLLAELNMARRAELEEQAERDKELARLEPFITLGEMIDAQYHTGEQEEQRILAAVQSLPPVNEEHKEQTLEEPPEGHEPKKKLAPGWFLVFAIIGCGVIGIIYVVNGGF